MSERNISKGYFYYAGISHMRPGCTPEGLPQLGKEIVAAFRARRERRMLEEMYNFDPSAPRPKTIFERLRRKGV